ncbi:hypothetical protein TNCV_2131271 [Trichonephila clavipes]|nr:hypothetical protein TNCV_2131271 [Trichonephila clavipes]
MIIRHVKDPLVVRLAWMLSAKIKFLTTNFASAELRCLPLGKKLGVKMTCDSCGHLNGAALKSDSRSWGMSAKVEIQGKRSLTSLSRSGDQQGAI